MILRPPTFNPAIFRHSLQGRIVGTSNLNPIAVARINAIYAAGGSCPVGQATATRLLSDFINAEQTAGRWANHRRIFIPGWGNAAANAIDIVGGTSGQFSASGITHGLGFAQGNGSSGFFDFLVTPSALGQTTTAGGYTALVVTPDSRTDFRVIIGASNSGSQDGYLAHNSANDMRFSYNAFPQSLLVSIARASQNGIISAGRTGTDLRMRRRTSSGVTSLGTASNPNSGTLPTANINLFRLSGTNLFHSNCQIGAASADLGFSVADRDAYTANLRTLWQGLFQLSLP